MSIVVFDVNETLLDLQALDELFEQAFGDRGVRRDWFAQVLQSAFVTTIVGTYVDFGSVGAAALDMVAERNGRTLATDARREILARMRHLPAHADAAPALDRLVGAGFRLGALTNSTLETARQQLGNAGLAGHFEHVLSADSVRCLKPAAAVYRHAADAFAADPGAIRLVAAHSWDVAGAMQAGCRAAFVARPGMVLDPLFEQPDIVEDDLQAVAQRIIERQA